MVPNGCRTLSSARNLGCCGGGSISDHTHFGIRLSVRVRDPRSWTRIPVRHVSARELGGSDRLLDLYGGEKPLGGGVLD